MTILAALGCLFLLIAFLAVFILAACKVAGDADAREDEARWARYGREPLLSEEVRRTLHPEAYDEREAS